MAAGVEVEVGGRRLSLSNLDKVLYPESGFTKAEVVSYYQAVAPVLLRHLEARPPTLVRAPNGYGGQTFFEKNCPQHRPPWMGAFAGHAATGGTRGCLIEEVAAVVWLAQQAALELHTHQWTTADPDRPTNMVIDLDPGPSASVLDCCRVALELKEMLDRFDLRSVVKTSGGKGLHLSVPLHGSSATDEDTKQFALALGQFLEARDPKRVTTTMAKDQRHGRVFVDWSQNDRHKTTVCAYSLRIRPRPSVSTPVGWDEIEAALTNDDADALTFEAPDVPARIDERGDLYADALTMHQQLPAL